MWLLHQPIAHRGLHSLTNPENSRGAFEAAIKENVGIELDVHCTADGEIIVIHDGDTTRATSKQYYVTEVEYATLRELRLFGSKHSIMLLREVLELVDGKVPLLIEIKTGTPASIIGTALLKELSSYEGDYAVISFDPRDLIWFKRNAPGVLRGLLSGTMNYHGDNLSTIQRVVLRSMVVIPLCKPDFIAFDVDAAESRALRFWRNRTNLPLLLWPVLTPNQRATATRLHANIIFEDINTDPYRYGAEAAIAPANK